MMFVKNHDGSTEIYFQSEDEEKRMLDILRPHGEWIDVNGDGSLWKCSNCNETSCCRGNFCSDCGASMVKKEGNQT